MRRLLGDGVCLSDYIAHLRRLLGFYEPFEAALAAVGSDVPRYRCANRSGLLKLDLQRLKISTHARDLPRCSIAPIDPAGVAGAMYVHAGAALGGQLIARHLKATLHLSQPFAFYREDGARTSRDWKAFCDSLAALDADRTATVCSTAVATFSAFESWMFVRGARSEEVYDA